MLSRAQSLKKKILLPLLLLVGCIMFVSVYAMHLKDQAQLETALHHRAKLIANLISYVVGSVTRAGELQRIVTAIGAEPDVLDIVVVGGVPPTVLASTKLSLLSNPERSLDRDIIDVLRDKEEKGFFNKERDLYDYTAPILVNRLISSDASVPQSAVMLHLDSRGEQATIYSSTYQIVCGFLAGLGMVSILGYLLIRQLVLTPLRKISTQLALRDKDPTARWEARFADDEIGHVANTLRNSLLNLDEALLDLRNQKFALDQHSLVSVTDAKGTIVYANERFCKTSGFSKEELVGQNHRIVSSKTHSKEFFADMWRTIRSGKVWNGQICNRAKGGDLYWVDTTLVPLPDAHGVPEAYISIRTDVTALREAKMQALAASRAKSDFLAVISHEMRTPLNGIIGMVEILRDGTLTPTQREQIADLDASARSLLSLINEILDLTKVEAGRLQLNHSPFNLNELIHKFLAILQFKAAEKNLEIHVEQADEVPINLIGDSERLGQVLLNLIDNSIKFCHEKGAVVVRIDSQPRDSDSVLLTFGVSDSGIGIPADKLEYIFEPFAQVDSSNRRAYGGAGIGLSISRTLVELMGGSLSVKSEENVGSHFQFTIPLGIDRSPKALPSTGSGTALAAPLSASSGTVEVLVVEDNPVNQKVAVHMLKQLGCVVTVAHHGKEALELLESDLHRFKIIFMDCQMPVMDGFEATLAIRKREENTSRHVIIVAMTANVMVGDEQVCLDAGMDAYLPKPVDRKALKAVLTRFLASENEKESAITSPSPSVPKSSTPERSPA